MSGLLPDPAGYAELLEQLKARVRTSQLRAVQAEFPDQRGWSRRNLHYMRALAEAWPEDFVQQPAARLPWGHLMVLLDKLSTRPEREWYAAAAGEYGWSRDVLADQVETKLAKRIGAAPSNFAGSLPAPDSDLAQQLLRDPYVFDHLTLTRPAGSASSSRR